MRCNTSELGIISTTAVGIFPHGASPYGVLDMSGNVWEWCLNKYETPEVTAVDQSGDRRVQRGGSSFDDLLGVRAAHRDYLDPDGRYKGYGFRVVVHRSLSPDH